MSYTKKITLTEMSIASLSMSDLDEMEQQEWSADEKRSFYY